MIEHNFSILIDLPNHSDDPEIYVDALFEAGLDDAYPGTGEHGVIDLLVCREANSVEKALITAIDQVNQAIPDARITEFSPDLMNLSDLATFFTDEAKPFEITRQCLRNYAFDRKKWSKSRFPAAATSSGSTSYWHASDVVRWMIDNEKIQKEHRLSFEHLHKLTSVVRAANALINDMESAKFVSIDDRNYIKNALKGKYTPHIHYSTIDNRVNQSALDQTRTTMSFKRVSYAGWTND